MISTSPMNGIAGLMMGVRAMIRMGRVFGLLRRRRWEEMSCGEMMRARCVAQVTIARRGRGVGGRKAGWVALGGGRGVAGPGSGQCALVSDVPGAPLV